MFTIAVGLPRGDGQVERFKKTVRSATGTDTTINNCDSNIILIQQSINNTEHRITKNTPAELLFGYLLLMDTDVHVNETQDEELVNVIKIRKESAQRTERNRLKENLQFNKKRKASKIFQVGVMVLTKITSIPGNNDSKKLLRKFHGLFKVVESLSNDRYRVREDRTTTRI